MTKTEAVALWRILSILAGWQEIVAVAEIEDELVWLVSRLPEPMRAEFADTDVANMLDVLRAEIEANLYYAEHPPGRHIADVPDPNGVLS